MYYLVACPETVVNIVNNGKLPHPLPHWLKVSSLFCTLLIQDCFDEDNASNHQVFVLELDMVVKSHKQAQVLFLEKIEPSFIRHIFVYSEQGLNLLNRLFGGKCPKKIVIQPDIYPKLPEPSNKRPREDAAAAQLLVPPEKRAKPLGANKTQDAKNRVDRISTYAEHLTILQQAFNSAEETILITSFDINHETLLEANLYQLIPAALSRGVKIYIYYNDQKDLGKNIVKFFKRHKVFCEQAYTHSKILAVDRDWLVTGSCNWLSFINSNYNESAEGSLILKGDFCDDFIEDFWVHIKHYRNQQFGNSEAVSKFERDPANDSTIIYELDKKTKLGYLPTLEQHCAFFQECFEKSQKSLVICSPFISTTGQYEDDIDHELLRSTVARGVEIFFVCSSSSKSLKDFKAFLAGVNSTKIHLIIIPDLHLKTTIRDDDVFSEGSFNWLSAMRNQNDYHNHEQTVYVEGDMAKELIANFFETPVGKCIINYVRSNEEYKKLTFFSQPSFTQDRRGNAGFQAGVPGPQVWERNNMFS